MKLISIVMLLLSLWSWSYQASDRSFPNEIRDFLDSFKSIKRKHLLHSFKKEVGILDKMQDFIGFPRVNTTSGLLTGSTLPECHSFYSIPYGEAPTGKLRFQPPVPVSYRRKLDVSIPNYLGCFETTLNCTDHQHCEQNLSEDCLVLNINVPATVDLTSQPKDLLPVMFWIHGGGFSIGSGTEAEYDGRWLCNSTNTIIVSINYRLDAFGFLVFEDDDVKFDGNQGLKDQQLALQWIQDNIEKFGGDKKKVTIFGQSAGAQSVMFHLMSPISEPIFQRAILQSIPFVTYQTKEEAMNDVTQTLLEALNCIGSDVVCLREASAKSILEASSQVSASNPSDRFNVIEPYRPVLDGIEFLEQPLDFFQSGKWQNTKEVIIGTTSEENYILKVATTNLGVRVPRLLYETLTRYLVGPDLAPAVIEEYIKLAGDDPGPGYDYINIYVQQSTDFVFLCPTRALARFMSSTASQHPPPIYLYTDHHPVIGEACDIQLLPCGYATHASDLLFLFNAGPNTGMVFSENDTLVANLFSKFWGNFAYFGTPSNDVHEWPYYATNTMKDGSIEQWTNIRLEAPESKTESNYRKDFCDFWDSTGFYVNVTSQTITSTTSNELEPTTDGARVLAFSKSLILTSIALMLNFIFVGL